VETGDGGRWRLWLPTVLLLIVALTQILLTRTGDLSPWKGGGFGMFATTDGTAFRYVRLFVEAPARSEELTIPASLEDAALRAQLFPSDRFLFRLGEAAAMRERRQKRSVSSVRVEVWKIEFTNGAPLRSTERKLRSFIVHVDPPFISEE
jgi:hypothetical protein